MRKPSNQVRTKEENLGDRLDKKYLNLIKKQERSTWSLMVNKKSLNLGKKTGKKKLELKLYCDIEDA